MPNNSGLAARYVRLFDGEPVPKRLGHDVCGLILMGGPMGVYEQARYPHLSDEMHLIDRALKEETPIFGTCLGSQLLASLLGSDVRRGERKEIGWHQIELGEGAVADAIWSPLASCLSLRPPPECARTSPPCARSPRSMSRRVAHITGSPVAIL